MSMAAAPRSPVTSNVTSLAAMAPGWPVCRKLARSAVARTVPDTVSEAPSASERTWNEET
jgi:hypothetical protein